MVLLRNILCLLLVFALGCGKSLPPPKVSLTEANSKFLESLKTYQYKDVSTKVVGTTLWIYVPIEKNILEVKASREKIAVDDKVAIKPSVNYLEGTFVDGVFRFDYDISDTRSYKKSYGYASTYSEEYQRIQQNILTSIQNSYFDALEKPDFVVLNISDVNNGIEMESIFYFKDLIQSLGMFASISQEEFLKRYVYDLRGSMNILQDKAGAHLNYRDVDMTDFLTKQIINRVNFKYQRSSFPPSSDSAKEILQIAAETMKNYDYQNFKSIELHNLADNSLQQTSKADLAKYLAAQ
jgi:hypothetical protein